MDGSDGENVVDRSIGTLVWVRRRNGSWWPGRIIASEELAAAHLLSARSGTPVKLLGREDASVDWYNLEKSKRVKAFRCGEFDACIKKAEASLGAPARKREKYARKQDAVIHALKLEQQQFGHPQQYEIVRTLKKRNSAAHVKESHSLHSDNCTADNQPKILKKLINNKSTVLSRNSVLSDDEENNSISHQSSHRENCSSTVALEEKNDKYFPQMNGLRNFDLSVAPPKKKFKFTDWEAACRPPDNHDNVLSTVEPVISDMDHKRQQTPNQVLLSSAHLPAFSSHEPDLQGERDNKGAIKQAGSIRVYVPGELCDSEDDSKGSSKEMRGRASHYNNSSDLDDETESDSSKAESLQFGIGVNKHISETSQTIGSRRESHGTCTSQASENLRCPNNNDESLAPSSSLSFYLQNQTMNSKWNSKGKRNIRNLRRHKMSGSVSSFQSPACRTYGNWIDPIRNRHDFIAHEKAHSKLTDIEIQVHTQNHRGEHVPWVSLSSKGNHGKPVLGHPVQVEILEDCSYVLPAYMRPAKRSAAHTAARSDQRKLLKGVGTEVLPVITCVPMKVVFSRILESVRPTS